MPKKPPRTEQEIKARLHMLPEDPILSDWCRCALTGEVRHSDPGKHEDHGWCHNRNYEECHCECPCHWPEAKFRLAIYGSASY